eukprot:gene12967-14300_t
MKGVALVFLVLNLVCEFNGHLVKLHLPEQIVHRFFGADKPRRSDWDLDVAQFVKAEGDRDAGMEDVNALGYEARENIRPNALNLKSRDRNDKEKGKGDFSLLKLLKHKKTPKRSGNDVKYADENNAGFKVPKSFWSMLSDTFTNKNPGAGSNGQKNEASMLQGVMRNGNNNMLNGKYFAQTNHSDESKQTVTTKGKANPQASSSMHQPTKSMRRKNASKPGLASLRSLVSPPKHGNNNPASNVTSSLKAPDNRATPGIAAKDGQATEAGDAVKNKAAQSSHSLVSARRNESSSAKDGKKTSEEFKEKSKGAELNTKVGGEKINMTVHEDDDEDTTAEEDAEIAQNNANEQNSLNDDKALLLEPEQFDAMTGRPKAEGEKMKGFDDDEDDDDRGYEEKDHMGLLRTDAINEVDDNEVINMATGERFSPNEAGDVKVEAKHEKSEPSDVKIGKDDNDNKQKKADGIDDSEFIDTSTGLRVSSSDGRQKNSTAQFRKNDNDASGKNNRKKAGDSIDDTKYIDMNNDASNKPGSKVEMKQAANGEIGTKPDGKKQAEVKKQAENKKKAEDSIDDTKYIDMNNDASNKPDNKVEMKQAANGEIGTKPDGKKQAEVKKQAENKNKAEDSIDDTKYIDMNNDASNKPDNKVEMKQAANGEIGTKPDGKKQAEVKKQAENKKKAEDSIDDTKYIDMNNDASNKPDNKVEMKQAANGEIGTKPDGKKQAEVKKQAENKKKAEDSIDDTKYIDMNNDASNKPDNKVEMKQAANGKIESKPDENKQFQDSVGRSSEFTDVSKDAASGRSATTVGELGAVGEQGDDAVAVNGGQSDAYQIKAVADDDEAEVSKNGLSLQEDQQSQGDVDATDAETQMQSNRPTSSISLDDRAKNVNNFDDEVEAQASSFLAKWGNRSGYEIGNSKTESDILADAKNIVSNDNNTAEVADNEDEASPKPTPPLTLDMFDESERQQSESEVAEKMKQELNDISSIAPIEGQVGNEKTSSMTNTKAVHKSSENASASTTAVAANEDAQKNNGESDEFIEYGSRKKPAEKASNLLMKTTQKIAQMKNKLWKETEKHDGSEVDFLAQNASSSVGEESAGNAKKNASLNGVGKQAAKTSGSSASGKNNVNSPAVKNAASAELKEVSVKNLTNAKVFSGSQSHSSRELSNNKGSDVNLTKNGEANSEFESDASSVGSVAIKSDRIGLEDVSNGVVLGPARTVELKTDIQATKSVAITAGSVRTDPAPSQKQAELGKNLVKGVSIDKKEDVKKTKDSSAGVQKNIAVKISNGSMVAPGKTANNLRLQQAKLNSTSTISKSLGNNTFALNQTVAAKSDAKHGGNDNNKTKTVEKGVINDKQIQAVLQEKLATARQLYSNLESTEAEGANLKNDASSFVLTGPSDVVLPDVTSTGAQTAPYQGITSSYEKDTLGDGTGMAEDNKRAMIESESKEIVSELQHAINLEQALLDAQNKFVFLAKKTLYFNAVKEKSNNNGPSNVDMGPSLENVGKKHLAANVNVNKNSNSAFDDSPKISPTDFEGKNIVVTLELLNEHFNKSLKSVNSKDFRS